AVLRPSLGALQHAEPRDGRETIACAFGLGPAALCSTGSRGELGSGCFGQRGPGRLSCPALRELSKRTTQALAGDRDDLPDLAKLPPVVARDLDLEGTATPGELEERVGLSSEVLPGLRLGSDGDFLAVLAQALRV